MDISRGPITAVLPDPQDIAGFDDAQAAAGIAATQELICMVEAAQARMIARLHHIRDRDRSVADEVGLELAVSRATAEDRIAVADALLTRLPCTLATMDAGKIDRYKVSKICEVTAPLSDEQRRRLDARIAPRRAGK